MTTTAEHLFNRITTEIPSFANEAADGFKVYPNKLPQHPETPAVRYQRITGERHPAMGVNTGDIRALYNVDVFATEYEDSTNGARTFADLVIAALDRYSGIFSGHEITAVYVTDDDDDFEDVSDLVRVRIGVEIWYKQ